MIRQISVRNALRRSVALFALAAAALAATTPAHAWGARGHELVAQAAVEAFSTNLPAFLRTKDAQETIIILSQIGRAHV